MAHNRKKYKLTIKGTRLEVTFTIDFSPPKITKALRTDKIIPIVSFH